jgi:hypothetical protein
VALPVETVWDGVLSPCNSRIPATAGVSLILPRIVVAGRRGVAGTVSDEPKLLRLARVPIRFQHMMTSQCSLRCICTCVISKITPYSRREPFQSNENVYSYSKTRSLFGLHTSVRCWLPSSLLEPGSGWRWVWLKLAADHPHVRYDRHRRGLK